MGAWPFTEQSEAISSKEATAFVVGLTTALALKLAYSCVVSTPEPPIIKAPARESQRESLYSTTYYPGSRDVDTPYGSIRLYEFGPEDGERLLFVHGITTPSPVFSGILPRMVDAGYRVCAFDLFGRGYSDSPDLKHDDRLYISQMLCVLQTVGWTRCSIIGYSLGGGLVSSFASYFANTVDKLILIAPAGLLVRKNLPLTRRIAMNENVPFGLIEALKSVVVPKAKEIAERDSAGRVDVTHVSQWQTDNHRGFPRSYLSSFRHAPIYDQWSLFARLKSKDLAVYAIWGDADDIVDTQVVGDNLRRALPDVKVKIIPGVGHDVCTGKPAEVVREILSILKT